MASTIFLAKVIGWYFVILGLFLIARKQTMKAAIADLVPDSGLMVIIATITLLLGLLLVISHNVWVMGWPVIVTIIAWLVLISGLLRLFAPEVSVRLGQKWAGSPTSVIVAAIIYIIVGLYLLYKAYYKAHMGV